MNHSAHKEYTLAPNESVFIDTEESIQLPNDIVETVSIRNSAIRLGLSIEAPVYRPGHHTRLFIRVTNLSEGAITLSAGQSICFLLLNKLVDKVAPYQGTFTNEFDYKGLGDFHKTPIPQ